MPERPIARVLVRPRLGPDTPAAEVPVDGRCRVVVERVQPEVDGGRFPIKRTVGESVRVIAWIHADGHDSLGVVLRYRPILLRGGESDWLEHEMQPLGNDEWTGSFDIEHQCPYDYTVLGWVDRFASWRHELAAKFDAGDDVATALLDAASLVRTLAEGARISHDADAAEWLAGQADLIAGPGAIHVRVRAALSDQLARLAHRFADRSHATAYDRVLRVSVDRERARCGAWYEMFPRSFGPDSTRSATFPEAEAHLQRVAAMGFDVVYLPPIHPIGQTCRKGRDNALIAKPGDPGSPWAIGSHAGGHKAVNPELGTLEDFDRFLEAARRLDLEVALDLAFQCSPDHPYVHQHPEWFRHRADGTIKHAENPPKKYQDIYPFDFECDAWRALWAELKSIVEFWIERGVMIFRVDNPHTKPYRFWAWLIPEVKAEYPDVIFLAEAFTRPKVAHYLGKIGFTQSYTYFTWRNTKDEIVDYFTELIRTELIEFFRPNLFANTPDILPGYLQQGGPAAFKIRLILAATLGASYGVYSGFELCENEAVPGTEEYRDSERYQFRHRDWGQPGHIGDLVAAINRIRRENPVLQSDRGLQFCGTDNPQLIAFCKRAPTGRQNPVLVVVNLDHDHTQHGWVEVPADLVNPSQTDAHHLTDLLDGLPYASHGTRIDVRLDPRVSVARVLRLPVAAPEVVAPTRQTLAEPHWTSGSSLSTKDRPGRSEGDE